MTIHETLTEAAPTPYRLDVDDFLLLDRAGRFTGHGRTELLGGEIYVMNAQHRPHGYAKMRLYDALREALGRLSSPLEVAVEVSVALTAHDAPEPDLTLTTEARGTGLIPGSSVALVVEVADATLAADLGDKAALYAAAGISEYWVADINARIVHQLWNPVDGVFGDRSETAFGAPLTSATIPGLTIATDRL